MNQILEGLTTVQLYEIVAQMKVRSHSHSHPTLLMRVQAFVLANQEQARRLLASYPALCYALLHAQVLLGMLRPDQVQVR